MKKLSIVIPTYNRASYVCENVKSLLPQLENYGDKVELMICDNASEDDTEELLAPFLAKYSYINYIRHKKNLGAHANFYYGVEHANGEYVVLLGDDDMLSPYYCDTILQILNDYHPDIINYNYLQINNKETELTLFDRDNYGKGLRLYEGATFIQTIWNKASFISCNVFKKELMLKGMKECFHPECYGYDWYLCLLYGVKDSTCAIHYDYPLAIQSVADNRTIPNWSLYAIVGMGNVYKFLNSYISGIWNNWKKSTRKDYCSFLYNICSVNVGKISAKEHKMEYHEHFNNNFEKMLFTISLHVDRVTMKIIKLIIKILCLVKCF